MGRLFGTDGVRGLANRDLTAELTMDLSVAAAHTLRSEGEFAGHRPRAIVGRDPRASGEFLSCATIAGLASAGVDVYDAGVLPTPAIAFLVSDYGVDLGAMLSASHNAMPDNGIKFFARGGHKLGDALEDDIEKRLGTPWERPVGEAVGRVRRLTDGAERYLNHLVEALPNRLDGLHVVLDTAHGAASEVAPEAFRRAGARVTQIGGEPDGLNINEGYGSTHLDKIQAAVVEEGADLGIAVDGDADRCLAVDASGLIVDGDKIMTILTLAMRERHALVGNTVVVTVMSNLGMLQALEREGISYVQTAVGDRYVLEEMKRGGYAIGGEQSGHVILSDHGTTGDGTLTGLMLAARVAQTATTLSELASAMTELPQVLINVKNVDKDRVAQDEGLQAAVAQVEAELGAEGRVLLRKSGTEPLVRVMVEANTLERATQCAERLADVVRDRLAL
ncbi:phosphoglucosamine mutase [Gephyromycinifex aptenodytis]|uniref:phosphoglucosamine mutase n=1 Tax=Gephyromycinifex aptenodytis TaxID=2716227 RepID=UPI00144840AB|nr:phosphoglucosamine mutase [Gephyromycinifex aptenodytis]